MILKDKTQTSSTSIKLDAGIKQEQDVAFYLCRAYKNRDSFASVVVPVLSFSAAS